jgi:polyisoprenoid-binding protein YceI
MHRRTSLGLIAAILTARPAAAAPRRYALDQTGSTVGFGYVLNGQPLNGRMPVKSARILLDVDQPSQSEVEAVIDAAAADAGPFYATSAMKSPEVLDTAAFPEISFRSTSILETDQGAALTGPLTVRGVTRDITLQSTVFRQRGTDAGDRSRLSILMQGQIDRREFGATGFLQFVQPTITLNILTRITLDET